MYIEPLPYALSPARFGFPALAALAGNRPLGDGREVVLATLMAARLASNLANDNPLAAEDRATRLAGARTWLASLTLPQQVRAPLLKCFEASAVDTAHAAASQTAAALRTVLTASSNWLDAESVQELERLIRRLQMRQLS